jgi:hypothetical protein
MSRSMTHYENHRSGLTSRRSQPPLALAVPLSRFTSRAGGGSAFYVRRIMNARSFISTVGLVLAFACGCQSPSPKPQPSGAQVPEGVSPEWRLVKAAYRRLFGESCMGIHRTESLTKRHSGQSGVMTQVHFGYSASHSFS